MKKNHSIITLDHLVLVHQTDAAYLFNSNGKNVWIPKAACQWDGEELQIEEQLAIEKELV